MHAVLFLHLMQTLDERAADLWSLGVSLEMQAMFWDVGGWGLQSFRLCKTSTLQNTCYLFVLCVMCVIVCLLLCVLRLLFVILLGRCPFDGSGAELQDATRLHRGSFGHFDGAWCFGALKPHISSCSS